MNALLALLALLALAALWGAARRAITVCELEIAHGRVRVVRGGLAPRILADVGDVAERACIVAARLRVVRDGGRARLDISGDVPEMQRQQLRNVIGSVPLAKLISRRR